MTCTSSSSILSFLFLRELTIGSVLLFSYELSRRVKTSFLVDTIIVPLADIPTSVGQRVHLDLDLVLNHALAPSPAAAPVRGHRGDFAPCLELSLRKGVALIVVTIRA